MPESSRTDVLAELVVDSLNKAIDIAVARAADGSVSGDIREIIQEIIEELGSNSGISQQDLEDAINAALPENRLLPSGGEIGQILTKTSNQDYDVCWTNGILDNSRITVGNVTNIRITASSGRIYLRWSDPVDAMIETTVLAQWVGTKVVRKAGSYPESVNDGVLIYENQTRDGHINIPFVDTGLTNGVEYYYQFFPIADNGAINNDQTSRASAVPMAIPLTDVIDLQGSVDNEITKIKWTDPADVTTDGIITAQWAGTWLVRNENDYPTDQNDGILVLNSLIHSQYAVSGFTDNTVINDTKYYYKLFPYTTDGVFTNNAANQIALTPTEIRYYGARWYKTLSPTALERTEDAIGLTFTASVGATSGNSGFDDIYPWSEIRRCVVINGAVTAYEDEPGYSVTPATGDVMVEIPVYYYKITDTPTYRDYIIADVDPLGTSPPDGFLLSPRHAPIPSKPDGYDKIYIGAYTCNSAYRSISGNASVVNMTRAAARTNCKNRGFGYYQLDFAAYWTIALLYLVEVADWNSQQIIGQGISSGSGQVNTGDSNAVLWHSGSPNPTDTRRAIKYRGIENIWGNIWQFTDGYNLNGTTVYINLNPATYADDTANNYTALSYNQVASASISFISALGYDSSFPWAQTPTTVSGSNNTYISDACWTSSGWRLLVLGGSWDNGASDGLFVFNSSYDSSSSAAWFCARLLVLP